MMIRVSLLLVPMTLFGALLFQQEKGEQESQQKQDKIEVPRDGEDAVARRDFMRTKLMYSQNIFHGLTTGNFKMINSGIEDLGGITAASKWVEIDDDRYRKLTEDFKTSVNRLKVAAESKNIEATALRFYQMSTSCIDCHQHIRVAKYQF